MILFLILFVQLRRARNFIFESFNLFSSFVPTLESSKKINIRVCFSFSSFLLFRQGRVARNFAFGYILNVFFFFSCFLFRQPRVKRNFVFGCVLVVFSFSFLSLDN